MAVQRLLLVAMAVFAISCQRELAQPTVIAQPEVIEQSNELTLVTAEDAIEYANTFICGGDTTRSTDLVVKSCDLYVAQQATRSSESPEVSFYLINYEDNKGFALVSTDSRTTPVYMYGEEGNLSVSDLESAPVSYFMESAIPNYIAEIDNYGTYGLGDDTIQMPGPGLIPPDLLDLPTVCIDGQFYFCKTIEEYVDTEPMVYAYWHQTYPYNKYAGPYTGCGINSVGQIMSYYEHPSSYNGYTYDWDVIKQQSTYSSECPASNMIAHLMYDMGAYLGVEYEPTGTLTYSSQSRQLFLEFGYTCSQVTSYGAYTSYLIANEIDARRPVWIRGEDSDVGHAWVVDAYRRTNITKEYYKKVFPYSLSFTQTSQTAEYYRCIWGQGGRVNPTYCLVTEFHYPDEIYFIYNIRPNID